MDLPSTADTELFRILGHPLRLRILELLCDRDQAVHELAELLGVDLNNLSQHLRLLRLSHVVICQRHAGRSVYSLVAPLHDLLRSADAVLGGLDRMNAAFLRQLADLEFLA